MNILLSWQFTLSVGVGCSVVIYCSIEGFCQFVCRQQDNEINLVLSTAGKIFFNDIFKGAGINNLF